MKRNIGELYASEGPFDAEHESLNNEGNSTDLEVAQLAKDLEAAKLLLVHLPPQLELHEAILLEAQSVFPQAQLPKGCSVITLH